MKNPGKEWFLLPGFKLVKIRSKFVLSLNEEEQQNILYGSLFTVDILSKFK